MSVEVQSATDPGLTLSKDRVEAGSVNIPVAKWPKSAKSTPTDPNAIVTKIVDEFNSSLRNGDIDAASRLFLESGYWRDHLGLSWDFRTIRGRDKIHAFLEQSGKSTKLEIDHSSEYRSPKYAALDAVGDVMGVQFFANFTSKHGSGQGVGRLVEKDGDWRVFTLFTTLRNITDHEEATGSRRPQGVQHGGRVDRKNWQERRVADLEYENKEPSVLVVGKIALNLFYFR